MSWINLAILSAATWGVVNIIDSHLISKRMPSFQAFLLPVGIINLIYGWILFTLFPLPADITLRTILIAVASGILRVAAATIMLYTMRKEEISRIIPITHTSPIFVAIMAIPLLGESLSYLKWLAIIIVAAGAVMISIKHSPSGTTTGLSKPLLLLFGSSLLFALADITSKYVLDYISFWNMTWLVTFCLVGAFLLASVRPHIFRQVSHMKQRNSTLGMILFNEALALVAVTLLFWAIAGGAVSLVSAIVGSRPIFVVVFALILSRISPMFLKWQPGKEMLALRLIATAMIVGGIVIIYLT